MDKRTFLKSMSLLGVGAPLTFPHLERALAKSKHKSASLVAKDEDFWATIRSGFKLKPDYINLENGYYCMLPEETLENFINQVREVNYQASWYMRTVQWDNKNAMVSKLLLPAQVEGVDGVDDRKADPGPSIGGVFRANTRQLQTR